MLRNDNHTESLIEQTGATTIAARGRASDAGKVRTGKRAPASVARSVAGMLIALALVAGMTGCASMSRSQKGAAIGSVAGGALGYVLTGGPIGTIAGAAVGGVVGSSR